VEERPLKVINLLKMQVMLRHGILSIKMMLPKLSGLEITQSLIGFGKQLMSSINIDYMRTRFQYILTTF